MVFIPHVRRTTKDNVLLLMDNCGPHGAEVSDPLGQIKITTLPPNCTSVHQPMDQGIIAALKKNYRFELLNRMLVVFESREELKEASKSMRAGTAGLMEGHNPHILDAMEIMSQVWRNMSEETVARCWMKADILPITQTATLVQQHGKTAPTLKDHPLAPKIEELVVMLKRLRIPKDADEFDPVVESVRHMLEMVDCQEKPLEHHLEEWANLEASEEISEYLSTEKLDVINATTISEVLSDEEEEEISDNDSVQEEVEETAVDYAAVTAKLLELQECLDSSGATGAVLFLKKARDEVFSHNRRVKMKEAEAKSRSRQTSINAFFGPK
mmetsp:Transcript_21584/g.60805  ORF Transcript_21584/g.60805 Transcript_21584/m.60805 type:complete len:327 (+) Transcript_21584:305-1285(+)